MFKQIIDIFIEPFFLLMGSSFNFIQTVSSLPEKSVGKRNLFKEIIDIFTDPFFLLMAGILAGLFYFIYTIFGLRNEGVSEEEEQLIRQLERYGLTYLSSKEEADRGPFEEPPTQSVSVFDEAPPQYLSYRTVKAQQANGDIVDFWVKFDYKKAAISVISWMPDINKFK